jgi:hypothetical protein
LALITLNDVTGYSDTDSIVFPSFVAYALIFMSVLVIIYSWLKPNPDNGFGRGQLVAPAAAGRKHDRCLPGDALCGVLTGNGDCLCRQPDRRPA